MAECQVKRHHAVAAVVVGGGIAGGGGAGGEGEAVPHKPVAPCLCIYGTARGVNHQFKGGHAVAARGVDQRVGIASRLGEPAPVPDVVVACGVGFLPRRTAADGQVQRHHAVAARGVERGVGRSIGAGPIGCAVPHEAVARRLDVGGVAAVVDGQVQRHHAVAARGGGQGVGSNGAGRVADAVPGVAVASRD